jgi:transcriptional regulator GlxA family with amidase domain
MQQTRTVGILIFDDVEVLDFCGPFEVFSVAGRRHCRELFRAVTVAETRAPVRGRGGLSINPEHSLSECPPLDIVVVPGGYGTRREVNNTAMIEWIRNRAEHAEALLSICTGALLVGRAGLLDGRDSTTHQGALDLLRETVPATRVHADRRVVDNGRVIVAAGISAGIDASLYVVSRLHGRDCAAETARYMEYDWDQERVTSSALLA